MRAAHGGLRFAHSAGDGSPQAISDRLSAVNHQLSAIIDQLPAISDQL
jgi:hypothetical protein